MLSRSSSGAALVRAYALTAGAAALRRGLPTLAGLLAGAAMLFGGNGIEAGTVVASARASAPVAALLWTGWLALTQSAVSALWGAPESFWLRSLPAPRTWHVGVLIAMSALAASPWVALWLLGGGVLAGVGALSGALALHAVALARPPGPSGVAALAATVAALSLSPPWLTLLWTVPLLLVAFRAAWLAAPTRVGLTRGGLAGSATLALAQAMLLGLVRAQPSALLRGALWVAISTAAAWLAARNNDLTDAPSLGVLAVGFHAPAALLAGSVAAGPMSTLVARAAWLLDALGVRPSVPAAAHLLADALVGASLGAAAGIVLAAAWRPMPGDAAILLTSMTAAGLASAAISGLALRWSARYGVRGPGRLILALFAALVVSLATLAALGAIAPWVWLATAGALACPALLQRSHPWFGEGGHDVLLCMKKIRKRLGTRLVLDDLDLSCAPGEIALITGENGSGKSTLLKIAAGVIEPDAGELWIGKSSLSQEEVAARHQLGFAPDSADAFPELGVHEFIALIAAIKRASPPPPERIARLGLRPVWRQRLRTLSFGQMKRVYLLAATTGDPPLWLLDEPSNGLDPDGVSLVEALLREHAGAGGGALVTTNDAAFAERLAATRYSFAEGRLRPRGG